jgi:hypothetical protein
MTKDRARKKMIEEMTEEEILENFDFEAELKRESEDNDSEENDFKPDDEVGHEEEGEEPRFPTMKELEAQQVTKLLGQLNLQIMKAKKFLAKKFKNRRFLIEPVLMESSILMIFGSKGIGKSWLALIIALILTRAKRVSDLPEIGGWKVRQKEEVLLVDAEMHPSTLQKRLKGLIRILGKGSKSHRLHILSGHDWFKNYGTKVSIAKQEWRDAIYKYLEQHDELKVVIFDNVASLAVGIDENQKQGWDMINDWLISIRMLEKAVIFIHHSGKNNQQRGTSARQDNLDCSVHLSHPNNYSNKDGAYFKAEFDKPPRDNTPGKSLSSFELKIVKKGKSGLTWISGIPKLNQAYIKAVALLINTDLTQNQIAEKVNKAPMTVTKYKQKAVANNLMSEKRKVTSKGQRFLSAHGLPFPKLLKTAGINKKSKKLK